MSDGIAMLAFTDILTGSIPLLLILGVIVGVNKYITYKRLNLFVKAGIDRIDSMEDDAFADFLKKLLDSCGYIIEKGAPSGGGTAAILARKGTTRYAVFGVKTNQKPSLREVHEVMKAMDTFSCTHGLLITNNYFTYPAKEMANRKKIILWDRKELAQQMVDHGMKIPESEAQA